MEEAAKTLVAVQEQIQELQRQIEFLEVSTPSIDDSSAATNVPIPAISSVPQTHASVEGRTQNLALTPSTPRLQLRAPQFSPTQPEIWFAILENIFTHQKITDDQEKFTLAVSNLDQRATSVVSDIILQPPRHQAYHALKTALITRCTKSPAQKLTQLLYHERRGDRSPSEYWRHLRSMVEVNLISNELLIHIWQQQLPSQVQLTLIAHEGQSLDKLLRIADRAYDTVGAAAVASMASTNTEDTRSNQASEVVDGQTQVCVAAASRRTSNLSETQQDLQTTLEKLVDRLQALERQMGTDKRRRTRRSANLQAQEHNEAQECNPGICWYHRRFGPQATKCTKPCSYPNGKGGPH